jgi:hypothetical protein
MKEDEPLRRKLLKPWRWTWQEWVFATICWGCLYVMVFQWSLALLRVRLAPPWFGRLVEIVFSPIIGPFW